MDTSQLLGLLFRWLHIVPMAVLVGGTIFMGLALVPASNETDGAAEFREAIRRRWAKWVGISVLFLLVSGLYNACLLYTSPSPRDATLSRMPSSA